MLNSILSVAAQAGSFIAVFAGITAAIIMTRVTKKFGTGLLATGFKAIGWGISCITAGMIIDSFSSYIQISGTVGSVVTTSLFIMKELFFVLGTYIIVIGSKRTGDKLETLTK